MSQGTAEGNKTKKTERTDNTQTQIKYTNKEHNDDMTNKNTERNTQRFRSIHRTTRDN